MHTNMTAVAAKLKLIFLNLVKMLLFLLNDSKGTQFLATKY